MMGSTGVPSLSARETVIFDTPTIAAMSDPAGGNSLGHACQQPADTRGTPCGRQQTEQSRPALSRANVGVEALEGTDHVTAVRLADGSRIEADLVVVGVGVTPATDWLADE